MKTRVPIPCPHNAWHFPLKSTIMATLERAIAIAVAAHEGQFDKNDQPYILHPLRVMLGVDDPTTRIVAVLHDVIEDTSMTLEDLRQAGFGEEVLGPLELVTHAKGVPYVDYVVCCKSDPIARQVKLSDLRDNSQLSRMILRPNRTKKDTARIHRYVLSYRFLTDQISESEYRELMDKVG